VWCRPTPAADGRGSRTARSRAARRLTDTDAWQAAETVKANPDAPQLPVRRAALRAGKTLYVAVPRLAEPEPFLELDPGRVEDVDAATTVSGASKAGVPVHPGEMPRVDCIVSGSVAVSEAGARVGKGEGYSDLEYGLLSEFDRVDETTATVTTVHELQVREGIEPDAHDVPIEVVCTPERTIETEPTTARPTGIDPGALTDEQRAEIPVLSELRGE
jgi:5-formyltetrahydrofolate cyclo-ligase